MSCLPPNPRGRFDTAFGKAHGAISIGVNSQTLGETAVERPHFIAGATSSIGEHLVPVAGGVIVFDEAGVRAGAVGISDDTSDNDEAAALAGIEAARLEPFADRITPSP